MLTVKVITTDPPPGMVKVPKVGFVSPTTGLTAAGCVAPPLSTTGAELAKVNPAGRASETLTFVAAEVLTALLVVMEYVATVPVDVLITLGVLVVLVTVSTGTHSAPEDDPGIAPGVVVSTAPGFPLVDP